MTATARRCWRCCSARLVDALEHEVAQLVHDRERRLVHAHVAGAQRLVDDRVDHRVDPQPARLAEALERRAAGKSSRLQHAGAHRVERVVGQVRDAVGVADADRLRASPAAARSSTSGRGSRRAPPRSGSGPRAPRRCARSARRGATRPARSTGDSASSPVWPNGEWPTSWPSAIASASGSLRLSAAASARAIWVTCSVCVRRVTKWSPSGLMKTCVLCLSRRNAFEWMIRSRSRSNAVRNSSGSSGRSRPRLAAGARRGRAQPLLFGLAGEAVATTQLACRR